MKTRLLVILLGISALFGSLSLHAEDRSMGFFVTSNGMGDGANLGGLKGACPL